jgi:hypothetical protein
MGGAAAPHGRPQGPHRQMHSRALMAAPRARSSSGHAEEGWLLAQGPALGGHGSLARAAAHLGTRCSVARRRALLNGLRGGARAALCAGAVRAQCRLRLFLRAPAGCCRGLLLAAAGVQLRECMLQRGSVCAHGSVCAPIRGLHACGGLPTRCSCPAGGARSPRRPHWLPA